MEIQYWTEFSKRKNSTKIPTDGETVDCVLKLPCSVSKPVLQLSAQYANITYFKMEERYYFVENVIRLTNSIVEVYGSCDVLATYRTEVLNTTAYVRRSSSKYTTKITDPLNPPTYSIRSSTVEYTLPGVSWSKTGSYLIGVVGYSQLATANINGFARYYNLGAESMIALVNKFCDQDFLENLKKEFDNPLECVINAIWIPISFGTLGGTSESIHFGSYDSGAYGIAITGRCFGNGTYDTIPITIDGVDLTDHTYLRNSPYVSGNIYLPYVGVVPFNADRYAGKDGIPIKYGIDVCTGDIEYFIGYDGGDCDTYHGNCSVQIPISVSGYSSMGVASGAIQAIGGALTTNVNGIVSGIENMFKSLETHTMTLGGTSGAVSAQFDFKVRATYFYREARNGILSCRQSKGLPCYSQSLLSGMSGYCECSDASVECFAYSEERDQINTYLNTGFFIE